MTFALARSLLLADAVTPAALAEALFLSATKGTSLVRALLAARAIDTLRLEQILERGEAPYMRHIAPVIPLVDRLPPGLCDRLLAVPVRSDPRTGTVDVAVVDARDPHPAEELGYWLKAPVRVVRTSIATMEAALLRIVARVESDPEPDPGMRSLAPPIWTPSPSPIPAALLRTPMYGSKAFDAAVASFEAGPPEDADIVIPLSRRNIVGQPAIEVGGDPYPVFDDPFEEGAGGGDRDGEPVLDLKRRRRTGTLPLPGSLPPAPPSIQTAGPLSGIPSSTGATGSAGAMGASASSGAPSRRSPPSTVPLPTSSKYPGALGTVIDRMLATPERDEIFELLVAGTRAVARRAGVLAVRRDALAGWTGSRELAERQVLRNVRLPNAMKTVFHEAFDREGPAVVTVPSDVAHGPLLTVLRSPLSGLVAVAPVLAEAKAVAVVFADGITEAAPALERLNVLARTAGEALGKLLRDKRPKSA
ncbi:MAG TPA: hypothetical protein VHV30_04580 [Polyangiaceae bacterium]|nr:hypothetical protein [Polyangiaceae bacterium]